MFYNSKSLIDEKVLQQYYFEKVMLAKAESFRLLIPPQYHELYSNSAKIKTLQPEVKLASGHITDFVLYPINGHAEKKLNIEIKWQAEKFLSEEGRFPFYNGEKEEGFLVCFDKRYPNGGHGEILPSISVIYLNIEDFKKWFAVNSFQIISQALANRSVIEPSRLAGNKYWVVSLTDSSIDHYVNFGQEKRIWAFKDAKRSKNIMKILHNDYIIFVQIKSTHGRDIYECYNCKKRIATSRGSTVKSSDIDWNIIFSDIYRVDKGYHLNFSSKIRYSGFEDNWDNQANSKQYTQFITMASIDESDYYQFKWHDHRDAKINRTLFPSNNKVLVELVRAFRTSKNHGGDAVEISIEAFQNYLQILNGL